MESGDCRMLRIAVCDDEAAAVKIIVKAVREWFSQKDGIYEYEIETFTDSGALAKKVGNGSGYDILFADISMPGTDGISLGVLLREKLSDTILVYISSREDLVFDAFNAQPFRFVRKKKFREELPVLMNDIFQEIIRRRGKKVAFPCGGTNILLWPEKIMYVESFKKVQMIHCEDCQYEVASSLARIMELLRGYGFVQIHKSYYVNCRYILSIHKNTVELDNHIQLPVGRSKLPQVKEAFRSCIMDGALE